MGETLHHQNPTLKLSHSVGHTDDMTDRHEHTSSVPGDGKQGKSCITKIEYLPVAYTLYSSDNYKLVTMLHSQFNLMLQYMIFDF